MIKVFLDPEELSVRLAALGWGSSFEIDEDWVTGELSRWSRCG